MVAIGADHGGYLLKEEIKRYFEEKNIEYRDFGTYSIDTVNYAEIAAELAHSVAGGECGKGILICGTGIGMSIAANKVKGIRAALCSEHFSAKYTRLHNDSNILCMGARVIGSGIAVELVDIFLKTEFEGGRHKERIDQILKIECGEM